MVRATAWRSAVHLVLRYIEVCFVKGKRLDQIGVAFEDFTRGRETAR